MSVVTVERGAALNKHHTPRGEDLSGVAGLYAADHGVGALNNGQSRIPPLDGDPAGKEAAHHHAAGQGFGSVLLCRGGTSSSSSSSSSSGWGLGVEV